MSKVRVYELAKETGLPNKEVIRRLAELGVEAKSHSSTIEEPVAARFRDSLGRQQEERRRASEERARREAEEYDLSALRKPAGDAKARRILPPHLRKQQEGQPSESDAQAARRFRPPPATPYRPAQPGGVSVGGEDEAAADTQPAAPAAPGTQQPAAQAPPAQVPRTDVPEPTTRPDEPVQPPTREPVQPPTREPVQPPTREPVQPAAREALSPQEAARRGLVRAAPPTEEHGGDGAPRGVPGVPRPGTPPRPGQPTVPPRPQRPMSPTATGAPVQPRRRLEHELPKEGSGKRYIPPPVRPAPQDAPAASAGPGQPSAPARGRPQRPSPAGAPQRPGGPPQPAGPARPGGAGAPARAKKKKGKKRKEPTLQDQFEEQVQPRQRRSGPLRAQVAGPVDVVSGITVGELAKTLGVGATDIVRILFAMGEMITVTQSLTDDLAEIVAAELGAEIRFVTPEELEFGVEEVDSEEELQPRAPVVTVMGHVDHGKTLLLDAIRSTDVASGEAGGITQHIGAYQVTKDSRKITFIDTPGHEAFTQMRARGARVTDVAILVVAADDGVMPQTVEAINHIRAADVPIIVAVNKIDKDNADPVRVRTQLTEHDLVAEEFGGQTTMVNVSAKTGDGLDELLEMVLLQADIAELQANRYRPARGTVIEAHLDRGRGAVATVLVQHGTLRIGDALVAGIADCKVRAMFDDDGQAVTEAGPAMPVQVLGWNEVPDAGDEFRVVSDERTAREVAENRQTRMRRMELAQQRKSLSLEDLSGAIAEGALQTLNLIVKGDVAGSVEAVADAMEKLELPEVKIRIIHKGAGAVTEGDVGLAETSSAIIIAFNVRPDANARRAIEESGVDLRHYSVIYKAVEDISNAVGGMLAPEFEEAITGRAEVREIFRVPKAGFVFGCYVTEGSVRRNASIRVVRDGVVVADDRVASLRRFKEDVTEVASGYECGVGLEKFQDIKVGDEFEVYEEREIARA